MVSDTLPSYSDYAEAPASPTYSLTAGNLERTIPSTASSLPDGRQWIFTADHMFINLGPRIWDLQAPCYGLQGKVEGSIKFKGERSHVVQVNAIVGSIFF